MKFSVGYPQSENAGFIQRIIENAGTVSEVYFSFGDIPNGRSPCVGELMFESTLRQMKDLSRISDAGIKLNLLLNANCYGEDSLSRGFFLKLGDTIDYLATRLDLSSVTTTSPLIAKFVKANFENLKTRASVNMSVGTLTAMDMLKDCFDGFYLKREQNRDLSAIEKTNAWCRENSKSLHILANSGCVNDCPAHTFHDNLVAHEAGIAARDNAYIFEGLCREYLKSSEKYSSIVRDMNYIRPEDINLYEGLCESMKLATRVNRNPERVLDAYLDRKYRGAVTDLLEPDNGSVMLPVIVDNSLFPGDFGKRVMTCRKNCTDCGYCEKVFEKAAVTL